MVYILVSAILIRSITDLLFKASVNKLEFKSMRSIFPNIKKALKTPYLWAAIALGVSNFWLWILVLKNYDLSFAYPLFSICYIFIILGGKVFFQEHLGKYKVTGIVLISLGTGILLL